MARELTPLEAAVARRLGHAPDLPTIWQAIDRLRARPTRANALASPHTLLRLRYGRDGQVIRMYRQIVTMCGYAPDHHIGAKVVCRALDILADELRAGYGRES